MPSTAMRRVSFKIAAIPSRESTRFSRQSAMTPVYQCGSSHALIFPHLGPHFLLGCVLVASSCILVPEGLTAVPGGNPQHGSQGSGETERALGLLQSRGAAAGKARRAR